MSRDLIDRLFAVKRDEKGGLAAMRQLQEALDFPDHHFATVHIAGTNGKGSVATKIAASIPGAGLFTSPHLRTFRERIRVGGEMIGEKELDEGLAVLFQLCEDWEIPATFFELATGLALRHFEHKEVELAVLETGLGGRLDATNVVMPKLTIITSIGLDHSEVLGETLEAIAREKGGIVKPGVPCILGPSAQGLGIEQICEERGAPCIRVECPVDSFLEENREIARVALEHLGAPLSGLDARPACRFEEREGVIFDVAHNAAGMRALLRELGDRPVRFAVGFSEGASSAEALQVLADSGVPVHLLEVPHSRMLPLEELCERFPAQPAQPSGDVARVLPHLVDSKETLVICGSCYLMESARAALEGARVKRTG